MHFTVLTIFPDMFIPFWEHGIIKRAIAGGRISCRAMDIRDFAKGRHRMTDDRPYGGGCGMVMKPEPLAGAIGEACKKNPESMTIHLTPQGRVFDQQTARALVSTPGLILVCGRYEGVDERVCQDLIDDDISIGDFVLTGGELAAMVVIDAVTRLIPGALGCSESAQNDTFSENLLEHAQYTRPQIFKGHPVPDVLISGHHEKINQWQLESSLIRTFLKRPDLLWKKHLGEREIDILKKWRCDIDAVINANRQENKS